MRKFLTIAVLISIFSLLHSEVPENYNFDFILDPDNPVIAPDRRDNSGYQSDYNGLKDNET